MGLDSISKSKVELFVSYPGLILSIDCRFCSCLINMTKYPTRLPFKLPQSLLEHFSNIGDQIFDPLCGSGMIGVVSYFLGRVHYWKFK